jgi:phosphate/phosphite/phosphonate ABC transporter binding protein
MLNFGYVAPHPSETRRAQFAEFVLAVGGRAGLDLAVVEAENYEELAASLRRGAADIAWLPPIPFIALERHDLVTPLAVQRERGRPEFHAVLVVRTASAIRTPADLSGRRAAWVDPYSASGYVVPRIQLHRLGVDPRTAFTEERFFRSHAAVVEAVLDRAADFGATYAGLDATGALVRGPWLDLPRAQEVRTLVTFPSIPGDVLAVRRGLAKGPRERLARALVLTARDPKDRALVRALFGRDDVQPWARRGYDEFRKLVALASKEGLLEGRERTP